MNDNNVNLPIGVFDSGVGGLTVLQALQRKLPEESFIYLGDTARLPYGTKSKETISHYVTQACGILLERGIKFLVIACNTAASSVDLTELQQNLISIPVVAVLEPGAQAACLASKTGKIAVLATEATVNSQSYQNAIKRIRHDADVIAQPCGLFVALAEEGWVDGEIAELVAEKYLQPILERHQKNPIDCLVLGCTHFPTLSATIKKVVGDSMEIIDSAKTTADIVAQTLQAKQLARFENTKPNTTFLVTDAPNRFARVAKQFLGWDIAEQQIELVNFIK